jgi:hypothetical protein
MSGFVPVRHYIEIQRVQHGVEPPWRAPLVPATPQANWPGHAKRMRYAAALAIVAAHGNA